LSLLIIILLGLRVSAGSIDHSTWLAAAEKEMPISTTMLVFGKKLAGRSPPAASLLDSFSVIVQTQILKAFGL
jgi:hypothetical protein